MKKNIIYTILGAVFNSLLFFFAAKLFAHENVFMWGGGYVIALVCVSLFMIFILKKTKIGISVLLTILLPVVLFVLLQLVVAIAYR